MPPVPWPEPAAFEANAAGQLTPDQRRMLLGGPVRPPYAALAVIAVALSAGSTPSPPGGEGVSRL